MLKNLKIKTIGSVDKPANGMAKVALMKRADEKSEDGPGETDETLMQKLYSFAKGLFGEGAKDYNTTSKEKDIEEDLWEKTRFLRESLESIFTDKTVTDKHSAIATTLQQFFTDMISGVSKAGRKISTSRLDMLKDMKEKLKSLIAEAEATSDTGNGDGLSKRGGEGKLPISEEVRKSLPKEVQDHLADIEKKAGEVDALAAKVADLEKSNGDQSGQDDIWKGVIPEVRKRMEDLETKAKEAEELAKSLQEKAENEQYLAKAAKLAVPGTNAEGIAAMMKSMAGNPDALAKFESMLAATNEQIAKGALFSEIGRSGTPAGGDTVAKVEALVNEKIQKSAGLTKEQAEAQVWLEHPELYKAYEEEQQQRRGN